VTSPGAFRLRLEWSESDYDVFADGVRRGDAVAVDATRRRAKLPLAAFAGLLTPEA
jgi:hypothetical protein